MIVNMTIDHALYVCRRMRTIDFKEVMAMRWDESADQFALDMYQSPGPSFTALNASGVPVAIGGVVLHTPKVGTAWLVGTEDFNHVGLSVTRQFRDMIKTLLSTELHRIQAWSACFHEKAHQWLERCGMTRGEPIRALGKQGEDFYLYSICRGGD